MPPTLPSPTLMFRMPTPALPSQPTKETQPAVGSILIVRRKGASDIKHARRRLAPRAIRLGGITTTTKPAMRVVYNAGGHFLHYNTQVTADLVIRAPTYTKKVSPQASTSKGDRPSKTDCLYRTISFRKFEAVGGTGSAIKNQSLLRAVIKKLSHDLCWLVEGGH